MARFTTDNAREMAARSVASRKAAKTERTAALAMVALPTTASAGTGPGIDVACSRARKLQRLEKQLEALDGFLDKAKTADEWHKLTTAKHRLLENFYILAGIAKPGSRRPGREKENRQQTPLGPLADIEPVPAGVP